MGTTRSQLNRPEPPASNESHGSPRIVKQAPAARQPSPLSKPAQLGVMLASPSLEFLMEAHNGLSAKIAEEAGHRGLWASGLSISAALGVRDNNEASWTQVLEVLEFMADATTVPILLDGDTGYGNFNNVRRLVQKLEQRGVAGVCLEDKEFPKTNSFIDGEKQALADVDEFAGKIKAGKDTQRDDDFVIVARTEALIAGWGVDEALRRAEEYRKAGADAILVHSKRRTPDEIVEFMQRWGDRCPVVIVPTTYYATPTEVFEQAGVSVVIWANHLLRSSVAAMQETALQIFHERCLHNVEDRVVPVREVFRLQGAAELKDAEKQYLPQRAGTRAIILAASRGQELLTLTEDKPKTMIPLGGRPLLGKLVNHLNAAGIRDVAVVVGYKPESVNVPGIRKIECAEYESSKELHSLFAARDELDAPAVISFGDILFRRFVLLNLLDEDADIAIVADATVEPAKKNDRYTDLLIATHPYERRYDAPPAELVRVDPDMPRDQAHGEWIGLMRCSAAGAAAVRSALDALSADPGFRQMRMRHLFDRLLADGRTIRVVYIDGQWFDVDDLDVLSDAGGF